MGPSGTPGTDDFGSGPLATAIQDLLSIAAYFSMAIVLLP
jgi:hypothetical protein